MKYLEMLEQAKIDRAWRRANPDPNRCNACWTTDYRMVNVKYKITDTGKDDGKTIGHVQRKHKVCNRCHPDPLGNQSSGGE